MKVLAVGGGSGGHVTPVAAVLKQLYNIDPKLEARFVCDHAFETQSRGIMSQLPFNVSVSVITAGKFRRYSHLTFWQHFTVPHVIINNTFDTVKIVWGFLESFWLLVSDRPDVVFAKGGYVCLPMGITAWLLRIPLVIHDSDMRPGLTNRILSRFATTIATGSALENYPYDKHKSHFTGVPVGAQFTPVSDEKQKLLKRQLGVDENKLLIIATGGGLGSQTINSAAIEAVKQLISDNVCLYVIAGKRNYAAAKQQGGGVEGIQVVDFVYDGMANILGAADIVVARGSATFLQELAGLEKTVVAIPARQLSDQIKNVEFYRSNDMAIVLTDAELAGGELVDTLKMLQGDADRRYELAHKLHQSAHPSAADDVARLIMQTIRKP